MIRIVVDTNVLISGTFWLGASARVIGLIEAQKVVLILSDAVVAEYDRIMHSEEIRNKVEHHYERVQAVQKILQSGQITEPTEAIRIVKDDPDDDKFIEAAVAGKADYLISRDAKHLLPLKQFRSVKIVTPEEFLALFKQ